ncbi:MAG TPA: (d)CMP kinase [Thermoguttaceae bacterium]|nr:(d)CMP kinase [Thermoguttaceae bacterium]
MLITIDGPAGAGKSTVARVLARRLGFDYLDTGAMYRAVALAGLRRGVDWRRPDRLAELATTLRLEWKDDRMFLDGEDVSQTIRSPEVTAITRHAADNPAVRAHLVNVQRALAANRNVVTEGRDQGTVAFPGADCKFFITATPEERARRRLADLERQGDAATLADVLEAQQSRDQRDAARPVGPLVKAPDAVEVVTDGMTVEQVVDRLVELIRQRPAQLDAKRV